MAFSGSDSMFNKHLSIIDSVYYLLKNSLAVKKGVALFKTASVKKL